MLSDKITFGICIPYRQWNPFSQGKCRQIILKRNFNGNFIKCGHFRINR